MKFIEGPECAQRVAVVSIGLSMTAETPEYHIGRCEFSLGQNVMDQAAVETSVAVLNGWM
jgi:hypothetical protein